MDWLELFGATTNLHFSHLHGSILHAQPYTPQVYTIPNLHDPQIYTTPNLHKIYTTPHLHKSNLHDSKLTQNKLANLIWFGYQNIARVQNCAEITIWNSLCLFFLFGKLSKKKGKYSVRLTKKVDTHTPPQFRSMFRDFIPTAVEHEQLQLSLW